MAKHLRTLWERLTGQNLPPPEAPPEKRYWNPLGVKVGHPFHLNLLDYREALWTLKAIEVFDRKPAPLTDYRLSGKFPDHAEPTEVILRTVPREGTTANDKLGLRILLLRLFFACGWDDDARPGIMEGVEDRSGEFVINPNTPEEQRYWRLHGRREPYAEVPVTILRDEDDNGRIDENEIKKCRVDYWDFSRMTRDEANQEFTEFLYVQRDTHTGWLEIWIGPEIEPELVNL